MAKPDPFELAAQQEGLTGVQLDIARSIYMQESSGGKNTTTSNAGAVGGMQVMPATFAGLADKGWDNNNPVHNARAGMRLIKQLYSSNGGDAGLTAVGYYGGPGAMAKAKNGQAVSDPRNPNAPDTIRYSDEVLARMPNNGNYARVVRTPTSTGYPVAPPVDTQAIPLHIPAYHGRPDEWSKFGRAMPQQPVKPTDMNYGKQSALTPAPETPALPLTPYESDPQMLARYMPKSTQPNMQAFQGWGSPL